MYNGTATMEIVWQFLKKLKIELPYEPAILFLVIHPKELNAETQREMCTPVYVAEVFTIAKSRSNPSVHQRMNG